MHQLGPGLTQYAAKDDRGMLEVRGITVSMSGKGVCRDNDPMTPVNGTVKVECVNDEHFESREQAQSPSNLSTFMPGSFAKILTILPARPPDAGA